MVGPILMALALLRTFYVLSYTSIIGDVCHRVGFDKPICIPSPSLLYTGFVATFVYAFMYPYTSRTPDDDDEPDPLVDNKLVMFDWNYLAPAMSSLAFLFCAHQVCPGYPNVVP